MRAPFKDSLEILSRAMGAEAFSNRMQLVSSACNKVLDSDI